jgi:hypothetical protein
MAPSPPHVALMKIIRDQTTPRKLHPGSYTQEEAV